MLLNKRSFFAFLMLGWAVSVAGAATWPANTCSEADVQKAVNLASSGDIVTIPSGTCTWTTTLLIGDPYNLATNPEKYLTLQGAGVGVTTIVDGITGTNTTHVLTWNTVDGGLTRLTGITFQGGTTADPYNDAIVMFKGQSPQVRIDHCTFIPTVGVVPGLTIEGGVVGVIDHNTFNISAGGAFGLYIFHNSWNNSGDYGDSSWASPDTLGTSQAMFVEDNLFTNDQSHTTQYYANDGMWGSRVVYRYNKFVNATWSNHGTESSGRPRSQRQFEIYNNTFSLNAGANYFEDFVDIRGGTGVIYNNTASGGVNTFAALKYFRSIQAFDPWGQCTGSNGWDQNSSSTGYRCMDQPGAGQGALLASNYAPTPVAWLNETLDPIYAWNNTISGPIVNVIVSDQPPMVLNRDYFNGTPKPGYTAYQYPHPLVTGSTPPPPPPPPTTSPCDVNKDGTTNVVDVQLEVNMALGISSCTNPDGQCTVVQVQRVVNAALGGQCVSP